MNSRAGARLWWTASAGVLVALLVGSFLLATSGREPGKTYDLGWAIDGVATQDYLTYSPDAGGALAMPREAQPARSGALPDPIVVSAPLSTGATAARSADGSSVVYSAWETLTPVSRTDESTPSEGTHMGVPSIRVVDVTTGTDTTLVRGASSFVLTTNEEVVFTRGVHDEYRFGDPYQASIQVVPLDGSSPPRVLVAESDDYSIVGATQSHVLFERNDDGQLPDLWATPVDGTEPFMVAADSILIADAPDGSEILTQALESPELDLTVVNTKSWAPVASLHLPVEATGGPAALERLGDWQGDRIVAAKPQGLIELQRTSSGLAVVAQHHIGIDVAPWGISEPRYSDGGAVQGLATIPPPQSYGFVDVNQAQSVAGTVPWDSMDSSDTGSTRVISCHTSAGCRSERPPADPTATSLYRIHGPRG